MRWKQITEAKIPFGKVPNIPGMTFGFESEIIVKAECFYNEIDLYDYDEDSICEEFNIEKADFDTAFQEWREEKPEREDSDMYDWISDVGEATWWKEVRATSYWCGIVNGEIVQYDGWDRVVENLADDMVEELGIETPNCGNIDQVFEKKDYTEWYIETDPSIHGSKEEDHGVEVVSPIFHTYDEFSDMLTRWLKWFPVRYSGEIYTNSTTGLHINIGIPDAKNRIDLLKLLLFSGEKWSAETWRGTSLEHTAEMLPMLMRGDANQGLPRTIAAANKVAVSMIKNLNDKAFAINLLTLFSRGYVEFRSIGGKDYEHKTKQVLDHISRFVQLIDIASDETLYAREYAQKLAKLLGGGQQEPVSPLPIRIITDWLNTRNFRETDRESFIHNGKITITPEKLFAFVGFLEVDEKPIPNTVIKVLIKGSGMTRQKYSAMCQEYDMRLPWSINEEVYLAARKKLDPLIL